MSPGSPARRSGARRRRQSRRVRLTALSPAGAADVEVDDGLPVRRLRGALARLTGDPSWLSRPFTADGVGLDDDHPAGVAPLRHGATVRPGPGATPDAVRAARAPWHLAVVAGPGTGALLVAEGPTTLGPRGELPVTDDEPWLVLLRPPRLPRPWRPRRARPHPSPVGVAGSGRPRRRPRVALVLVRGTTSPAYLVPARGRARRIARWRWTSWRVGDRLQAGSSTLALRLRDAPPAARRHDPARWLRLAPAAAGATTSAALAATMHQPVLLLGALSALVLVGQRPAPPGPRPGPEPEPPLDLAALRVALAADPTGAALRSRDGTADALAGHAPPERPPGPAGRSGVLSAVWEGELTVAGPRPAALAAARGLLLDLLAADPAAAVELRTGRPGDWSWLRWFDGTVTCSGVSGRDGPTGRPLTGHGATGDGGRIRRRLVVVDDERPPGRVDGPGRVLRLVGGRPPPWCTTVLEVGGRTARLTEGDRTRALPFVGVSPGVAEAVARGLAGRSHPHPASSGDVLLGDLPGVPPPEAGAIALRWGRPALTVPVGRAADGSPVVVDLVRDGPHALVAGTTGSGKSELLATITLGLALAQPPDRLAVLLVDFKGATGLPPALAGLPHVVGHLSDLDAAAARRTLRGLAAELRRRERILAARAARDLAELDPADPGTPPRLLVVVDEFQALADELPELLPSWARLAAQGRSLGVHLVLATQRPAGAVPADLRANVGLRAVLRVVDAADSTDLVGIPDAAGFDRAGLALLARGPGRPEVLRVARALPGRRRQPVRLAAPWSAGPGWTPVAPPGPSGTDPARPARAPERDTAEPTDPRPEGGRPTGPAGGPPTRPDDGPSAWVRAIRAAAAGRPSATGPWLPPLPPHVEWSDVPSGPGLPLALADLPDELSRGPVRWDPDAGHLLVLGGPGSGRSTTLAAVASAALAAGRPVHAVGLPSGLVPRGVASQLDVEDGARVARLVRLLSGGRPAAGRRPLLLVDDLPAVAAVLGPLARGAALECLERLWAVAGGPVAVVAAGGIGGATLRLSPSFADRLVLGSPDPTGDVLAGVPLELAGQRRRPGRAVHLGRGEAVLCQVALAPAGRPEDAAARADGATPDDATPRVRTLPTRVSGPLPPGPAPFVALGLGGDDAGPVGMDLTLPLLVVGPRGSGRTTALDVLAAGAANAGLRVVRPRCAADLDAEGALLVVDDVDELEARDPALAEALAGRLGARDPLHLVAATTTAHAVGAFRGPVPTLCRAARLLVLDVTEPGAADLLGPEGPWLAEARRQPPGRGALRLGRDVVPLQVACLERRPGKAPHGAEQNP